MNVVYQGTKSIFVVGTCVVMFPEEVVPLMFAAYLHAPNMDAMKDLLAMTIKRANNQATEEEVAALSEWFLKTFEEQKQKKEKQDAENNDESSASA